MRMYKVNKVFGKKVKRARKQEKLSQEKLAEKDIILILPVATPNYEIPVIELILK